jgi:hypothetical protein
MNILASGTGQSCMVPICDDELYEDAIAALEIDLTDEEVTKLESAYRPKLVAGHV